MKNIFLLIIMFVPAFAASQELLSLHDCLRIGLDKNFEIRLSKKEQQIAENNATVGNAGFLPTIDLSSNFNATGTGNDQYPMDGSEKVSVRNSHNEALNAGVSLNWTVFDGFRIQTTYRKLKELNEIGELNTQLSVENFISGLSAEYYNYVQQNIRIKNLRYAMNLSRERLRIVEARYQIGNMSRLDLEQARVDFNTDSSRLILQNEALNNSRLKLNELMGNPNVDHQFKAADTTITVNILQDKDELHEKIFTNNVLIKISEKGKSISELDLKTAKSQNFPYLQLNAGYGLTHFNYNSGNIDKQNTWGPNVGITLGFKLFDGFNNIREQKNARIRIESEQVRNEQLRLSLSSSFTNMWLSYTNNIKLISLEKVSLENAQTNFGIAMDRYKLGDLSGFQLREAQNNLIAAEERLLTAQYNTKLYEISLKQISGKISDYLED